MDDYIRRADALRLIADIQLTNTPKDGDSYKNGVYNGLAYAFDAVYEIKPADARPVPHARWIDFEDGSMCSGCGASHDGVNRNYCPNCGADMGGTP